MKVILILVAVVAAVVAHPTEQLTPRVVPILDYQLVRDAYGQFDWRYLTGDGTKVAERGALVPNKDGTGHVLIKEGSFTYYAPDGSEIVQTWTADGDGFHPKGDHLPTTPASDPAPTSS